MKKIFFASALMCLLMASTAFAGTRIGASAAFGDEDTGAFTVFAEQKYEPWFSGELGEIAPTGEIGASWWTMEDDDDVYGAFLAPGIRLTMFTSSGKISPFIGASVGGALISEEKFEGKDLGSNLLFRTKGTAGFEFGDEKEHRLQGEYTHHSTWGITNHSDPYSTYGVSYGYSF